MIIENIVKDYFRRTNKVILDEDIKKVYEGILNICQKNNIDVNSLYYLSEGESSLAFESEDKIIKFIPVNKGVKLTEFLKDSKHILQPLAEEIVPIKYPMPRGMFYEFDMSIIIEEKLNIDNTITISEALNIAKKLLNDGYIWLDIKPANLGRDSNGNIKLFDYGQLSNKKYDEHYATNLKKFAIKCESLSKPQKEKRSFFQR